MTLLFAGCKKEATQQPNGSNTRTTQSAVKTANRPFEREEDVEAIVKDAEEFQQYADDLRDNITPNVGGLPTAFSPEDAVFLIESTTNYYYGRPNYFRSEDTTQTFYKSVTLDYESNIKLEDLAALYNQFRDDFKDLYGGISGNEKSFGYTDYEYDAEKGELRAVPIVHIGEESELRLTWRNIHQDQVFTGANFWNNSFSIYQGGTNNIGCPSNPRPEPILSDYVRQNLGFYDYPIRSNYDPIPVAINVVSDAIDPDDPRAQTANSNPLLNYQMDAYDYKRLFACVVPTGIGLDNCLTVAVMNYFRSEQKQMIKDDEIAKGKKCIRYVLSNSARANGQIPSSSATGLDYIHILDVGNLQYANIIYVPSPSLATF